MDLISCNLMLKVIFLFQSFLVMTVVRGSYFMFGFWVGSTKKYEV